MKNKLLFGHNSCDLESETDTHTAGGHMLLSYHYSIKREINIYCVQVFLFFP